MPAGVDVTQRVTEYQKYIIMERVSGSESPAVGIGGSPVLSAYREAGLIDTFPLHDDEMLTKLYADWKKAPMLNPPIEHIRDYFGENVGPSTFENEVALVYFGHYN